MPGNYILYEFIITKNQLDICPKQEIRKYLLFHLQFYSMLAEWNEGQSLNTFSRDFLLNQAVNGHSVYSDIVLGDGKVTSRKTQTESHSLVEAEGIRHFGIKMHSNRHYYGIP